MPRLAFLVNSDLKRGFTVAQVWGADGLTLNERKQNEETMDAIKITEHFQSVLKIHISSMGEI